MEASAGVVIVGAGIVGCSAAEHLTRLGWTDVVVVDQGPLFEAGWSGVEWRNLTGGIVALHRARA